MRLLVYVFYYSCKSTGRYIFASLSSLYTRRRAARQAYGTVSFVHLLQTENEVFIFVFSVNTPRKHKSPGRISLRGFLQSLIHKICKSFHQFLYFSQHLVYLSFIIRQTGLVPPVYFLNFCIYIRDCCDPSTQKRGRRRYAAASPFAYYAFLSPLLSGRFKKLRRLLHQLDNRQMLRTYTFTLTALDAV